jgi:3-hydroxybutyryl-CoA dehydrogenase
MAPGIAAACAATGSVTTIVGRTPARLKKAANEAIALVDAPIHWLPLAAESLAQVDLAIETATEDLVIKKELLARVDGWLPAEALLATNTSSLSIGALADAVASPERFAGFHFLNPAHLTGVVEVVPGPATGVETVDRLARFARRMDKVALVLGRDIPGFIWNRIQFAVLRECLYLLREGFADVESIDAAVSDGLAPRWTSLGPLATADLGGLDTFRRAAAHLFPRLTCDAELRRDLERDRFYRWKPESERALENLRSDAITAARELASRRRQSMPEAEGLTVSAPALVRRESRGRTVKQTTPGVRPGVVSEASAVPRCRTGLRSELLDRRNLLWVESLDTGRFSALPLEDVNVLDRVSWERWILVGDGSADALDVLEVRVGVSDGRPLGRPSS